MFDKMKKLYQLRKIQQELKQTTVEAERMGGKIKVVMTGEFKPQEIKIDPSLLSEDNAFQLEKSLKEAFIEALGKAQQVAASKMREMGDLDIPGI